MTRPAAAVRIGTSRRPEKKPRKSGIFVRWNRCQRFAATSPITMPPRTPKLIVAWSPFASFTPARTIGDMTFHTSDMTM